MGRPRWFGEALMTIREIVHGPEILVVETNLAEGGWFLKMDTMRI